jgi:hypothetical protein
VATYTAKTHSLKAPCAVSYLPWPIRAHPALFCSAYDLLLWISHPPSPYHPVTHRLSSAIRMRSLLSLLAGAAFLFACAKSFEHDPKTAAKRAEEFAQAVFVRQDFDRGYAMLSDSGKRYVPLEKFKETVIKSHPRSYPTRIAATDYEPMAGEKAIYIYVSGENAGEQFNYTLTLDGTASSGYQVTRFSRSAAGSGSREPLNK